MLPLRDISGRCESTHTTGLVFDSEESSRFSLLRKMISGLILFKLWDTSETIKCLH